MDKLTPEKRSANMSRIRSKGMKPELAVRSIAHRLGFRFRLHAKDLPGKPDLVFRSRRKAIFVHGCFWHCHSCKEGQREPKSNIDYWRQKIARNRARDELHQRALEEMGWQSLAIWECEIKRPEDVATRVQTFLSDKKGKRR